MSKNMNLQDAILNYVRKEKAFVSIYLTSGLHFKGNVIGFDNFVIISRLLEGEFINYNNVIPKDKEIYLQYLKHIL